MSTRLMLADWARRLALAFAASLLPALLPPAVAGAEEAAKPRLVSIHLCTDQLVLALADREQILALSSWARDPSMSYLAPAAEGLPTIGGSAEEVLALGPDVALAGSYTKRATRQLLTRLGVPVVEIDTADTFEEAYTNIRKVAGAIGQSARGGDLVARMQDALAAATHHAPAPEAPRALQYQRRGYVSGTGTMMDVLFGAAGLRNAASELELSSVAQVSLEQVVRLAPDVLVLNHDAGEAVDIGTDLLRHPALSRMVDKSRQVVLPTALTVCGTPGLAEVPERLREAAAPSTR